MFDFIVAEFTAREPEDARRIHPMRVALQNQGDGLLALTVVLIAALSAPETAHEPLQQDAGRQLGLDMEASVP